MKLYTTTLILLGFGFALFSCDSETRESLSKAKDDLSTASDLVTNIQEAKEDTEKLKGLTPLTNDQLKGWLPESLDGMARTGFVVGKTGYMNVASIEGTFKSEDGRKFEINVIDGAGETGSILMTGMGMASNMDMEQEDENKHVRTVTVNGIKAQQTYHKKREDTDIQFVYNDRFGVMVTGKDLQPEKTWELIDKINLGKLNDLTD